MPDPVLALINLTNDDAYVFQFFPNEDRMTDRANWEPQETTIGTKPLFYANREPRSIEFSELYIDSTMRRESLTEELEHLRSLMNEVDQAGSPPALLASWGDRSERCVLQDLAIETVLYDGEGMPLRARVSLVLLQLQPDSNEATTVQGT